MAVRPIASCGGERRRQITVGVETPVGEEPDTTGDHGAPVDDTLHPESLHVGEGLDRREVADLGSRSGGDRLRDRVLRGILECTDVAQHLRPLDIGGGDDVDQRHVAGCHRAGLVEHDRVDRARGLEHLGSLDQDAHLGAATGADEQRGRCRQTQRARAGDDQHGDRGGERAGRGSAVGEPPAEGADRERDDHRDEHRRDAIGDSLHGGLAVLRFGDETCHLRQRRVGADPCRADYEPTSGVHCRAGHGVARRDFDRHRFAGQQRGIDRRCARLDDAVGGDLLAGSDHELVADGELLDRDAHLDTVPQNGDVLGAEFEQRSQGGTGACAWRGSRSSGRRG